MMKDIKTAMALVEAGQVEEAYQLLQSILKKAKDDEKFIIAELYEEWGYFEEAAEIIQDLLKRYPKEGQLLIKLAEIYIELDKDEHAIRLLNSIDSNNPFYIHALLLLADTYEREGLFEVAEQKLLEAKHIVSNEEGYIIDFALGELLFSVGEAKRAITFYEKALKIIDEINGISLIERLAESHAYIGQYETSLYYYDKLSNKDPNRLFKHAYVAYQAKEIERAIQLWHRTIEIDPYYHSAYFELASLYEEVGKIEEAYKVVNEGLDYDEFDKRLYFMAGKLSLKLGNEKEAIKQLREAIVLDEDYKDAILLLANIFSENDANEELVNLFKEIKLLGGTDPLYDWELAKAYNELEMYAEARKSYEEAYFHLADDSVFLKEYGYFLIEDGSFDKGTKILTKYVELEPDDTETIAYLDRIHFSNDSEI